MAKHRRRGLNNQDIKLAQQRAKVRFGPEHSTIKALVGQAQSNYASDLTSADAAAKSAIHFAKKARKPVAQVFNVARSEADAARSDVEAAFGKLGGAADPFRAATAREQAGAHERVALAGANALHELTQRQLEAKAGGQYAKTAARQDFRKTLGDLSQRLRDLGDREGAFITQEAGALQQARAQRKAATRAVRLRGRQQAQQEETKFGHQKDLEKLKASLKPKTSSGGPGLGPASRSELRMFKSDFAKALSYAKQYGSRADARAELIPGAPAAKDKKGNLIPATPSIDDQLALSAALDMAFDGHVSRANARAMKQAGIRVKDLPSAISYTKWLHKRTPGRSSGGGGGPRGAGRL